MTCREKLKIEHPECVGSYYTGGCEGCPSDYGYLCDPDYCANRNHRGFLEHNCEMCWDREIPGTPDYYHYQHVVEPLIFEPEDWSEDEWATICKIFGVVEAERIKVTNYMLEFYGVPRTDTYINCEED